MYGLIDGNNFFVSCELIFDRKLVGKPFAVLSNNDGCCIALSKELKAMGVTRGTPYFQLKAQDVANGGNIYFRSVNFELYGDISHRLMSVLRETSPKVEQYSIDEAFIALDNDYLNFDDFGLELREKILRYVGVPCGIGFAPTKTLAKIANHIGKKRASGVFVMPSNSDQILANLPVNEVWGVGRQMTVILARERIHSAKDLRDTDNETLRQIGGVVLERTALELRGMDCITAIDDELGPDSVSFSRTFARHVDKLSEISESIASYLAKAAQKLRHYDKLATGCNIYVQLLNGEFREMTVVFKTATNATNEILSEVIEKVGFLVRSGESYRKSGVVFFGLENTNSLRQPDFFDTIGSSSKLYKAIDKLNLQMGENMVSSALEQCHGDQSWRVRRNLLSPRYTTRWSEITRVK